MSSAGDTERSPEGTAVLNVSQRRLVCVEYPGVVRHLDRALETLRGEKGVSKTYSDPSKRLELYYRPRDPYCHPVCGNRYPSTNLLLRVRRRVRKGEGGGEAQVAMEVLGVIGTTYKFQGMADFQYLAIHMRPDSTHMSLYDKIILRQPETKEFFDMDVPLFIPPPIFSRLDTPVDYYYRPEIQHREGYVPPAVSSENLIGLSRARRPHNAIFVSFEDKTVPMEPLEPAVQNWKRVCVHPSEIKAEEELKKMFERRPIWSRNAVKANLDIHPEKLKLLLPYLAYYMLTGPWRSLWVRFGYDPRTKPEAKAYQVLDFRIRCGMKHGYTPNDLPVKAKRSTYNYSLPTTVNKAGPQPASLREITQEGSAPPGRKPAPLRYKLKESAYIFRDGTLPPYRQMFYQLCDLDVESIKKVIHCNDGQEEECNERDGWCLPRTTDELRNIMSSMIKQVIRAKKPGLFPANAKDTADEAGHGSQERESGEEDEEEFQPSEGSDNEMETEILEYM
ncbi:general transcription factor 3C polypeptide 5 [Scleropages formosus]|uniref:general transcription factor 3C polypeptide 5 n=1 Tax=Scleropages formosus TaxID=113540 RepID=UPI00087900C1|nr:general transcription factor 3C polypeptide 5 [Scleropages formosus]